MVIVKLVTRDHTVPNFVVFRLRQYAARYQIMRILKGTVRDNSVGLVLGQVRQPEQVFARGAIDIDGLVVAPHALAHAFSHGLGVPAHGFGRLGGTLPDFIGIVAAIGTSGDTNEWQGQQQNGDAAEISKWHDFLMP